MTCKPEMFKQVGHLCLEKITVDLGMYHMFGEQWLFGMFVGKMDRIGL